MEFFRIKKDIPFMRHALVFNAISALTFVAAVFFLFAKDDPQLAARNMIQSIPHPAAGPIKVLGSPIKLSRTPGFEPVMMR